MTHVVTPKILGHISNMISSGRPIWALLWANEYLRREPEIRSAYVQKAKTQMRLAESQIFEKGLIDLIFSGSTLNELPTPFQTQIKQTTETSTRRKRAIIQMKPWRSLRESGARRVVNGNVASSRIR